MKEFRRGEVARGACGARCTRCERWRCARIAAGVDVPAVRVDTRRGARAMPEESVPEAGRTMRWPIHVRLRREGRGRELRVPRSVGRRLPRLRVSARRGRHRRGRRPRIFRRRRRRRVVRLRLRRVRRVRRAARKFCVASIGADFDAPSSWTTPAIRLVDARDPPGRRARRVCASWTTPAIRDEAQTRRARDRGRVDARRYGKPDDDCCAAPENAYCAEGFTYAPGAASACPDGQVATCCVEADAPAPLVDETCPLVLNRQELSFADAEKHCVALGGHLATIPDRRVAAYVDGHFVRPGGSCTSLWIGYSDAAVEGEWAWIDGSASKWENWWGKEPNNMGGGPGEDCASLGADCLYHFPGVRTGWVDSGCEPGTYSYHPRASVCQLRPLRDGDCVGDRGDAPPPDKGCPWNACPFPELCGAAAARSRRGRPPRGARRGGRGRPPPPQVIFSHVTNLLRRAGPARSSKEKASSAAAASAPRTRSDTPRTRRARRTRGRPSSSRIIRDPAAAAAGPTGPATSRKGGARRPPPPPAW